MAQCKGIKKDGNRCKSPVVLDDGYCAAHQEQALKKLKFYSQTLFIVLGIALSIIAILVSWHYGIFGATKEDQQNIIEKQNNLQNTTYAIKKKLDVTNEILIKQLEQYRASNIDRLESDYDLGFRLIGVNQKRNIISDPPNNIGEIYVDWRPFRVVEYAPQHSIIFDSPIFTIDGQGLRSMRVFQLAITNSRMGLIKKPNIFVFSEIILQTPEGVALVFGFSNRSLATDYALTLN